MSSSTGPPRPPPHESPYESSTRAVPASRPPQPAQIVAHAPPLRALREALASSEHRAALRERVAKHLRKRAIDGAVDTAALLAFVSSCDLVAKTTGKKVLKSATPRKELLIRYAPQVFAAGSAVLPRAFAEIITNRYGVKLPLPQIIVFALYAFLCVLVATFLKSVTTAAAPFTRAAGQGFLCAVSAGIIMCGLFASVLSSKRLRSANDVSVQSLFRFLTEMSRVMSIYLKFLPAKEEPAASSTVTWFVREAGRAIARSFARSLRDAVFHEIQRRAGVPPHFRVYVDFAAHFLNVFSYLGGALLSVTGLVLPENSELMKTVLETWRTFDDISPAGLDSRPSDAFLLRNENGRASIS